MSQANAQRAFATDQLFDYNKITYLSDFKKNVNFSIMQSLILIAAFLAGRNKESLDQKIFL